MARAPKKPTSSPPEGADPAKADKPTTKKPAGSRAGATKRQTTKAQAPATTGRKTSTSKATTTRQKAAAKKPAASKRASAAPAKRKPGRPSSFTEEIAEEICRRISLGETLTAICKEDDKPHIATIYDWQRAHPSFDEAFARARVRQMQTWGDQIIALADDDEHDMIEGKTGPKLNRQHVERVKMRIDTRQWLMTRIAPHLYSERHKIDVSHNYGTMDDAELLHQIRTLGDQLGVPGDVMELLISVLQGNAPDV